MQWRNNSPVEEIPEDDLADTKELNKSDQTTSPT